MLRSGNAQKSKEHEFMLNVHAETPDAFLLSATGNKKDGKWFPKSHVQIKEKHLCTFVVPEWIANKNNMF
jgi:hypothetical protein